MFDMKANNVVEGDKLIDTQNHLWVVKQVDDDDALCYCFCENDKLYPHGLWFRVNGFNNNSEDYEIVGFAPGYGNQEIANKPHKHKDLIIAWANGAEIEYFNDSTGSWQWTDEPYWSEDTQYRIKPEPNPDVVKYMGVELDPLSRQHKQSGLYYDGSITEYYKNQLKLTFCGETGKLKSAEVIS